MNIITRINSFFDRLLKPSPSTLSQAKSLTPTSRKTKSRREVRVTPVRPGFCRISAPAGLDPSSAHLGRDARHAREHSPRDDARGRSGGEASLRTRRRRSSSRGWHARVASPASRVALGARRHMPRRVCRSVRERRDRTSRRLEPLRARALAKRRERESRATVVA